jgi:hypothetical protein
MSTHLLHLHLHPGKGRHVNIHCIAMLLLLLQRHQQGVLLRLHRLHARKAWRSSTCASTTLEVVRLVLAVLAPAQLTSMQHSTSTSAQTQAQLQAPQQLQTCSGFVIMLQKCTPHHPSSATHLHMSEQRTLAS